MVTRSNCFIGKSNWNDSFSYSYIDNLRIYNKSLSQDELIEIMNQNEENCKLNFIFLTFAIESYN